MIINGDVKGNQEQTVSFLRNLNLTITDHVPVYWYNEETQSMHWEYADELLNPVDELEYPYQGQRLFADAIDYYAIEVCEQLQEALLDCDTARADRLMETIKQAMQDYI